METKEKEVIEVNVQGYNCIVHFEVYSNNGRKAIWLLDKETGEENFYASVNIPDVELRENEVIIKDYSENEGVLNALISAGVVSKSIFFAKGLPVCELLI